MNDSFNNKRKDDQRDTLIESGFSKRAEDQKDSCSSCLFVGVATCTGLAGYFAHMAFELPPATETAAAAMIRKPTLLTISVGWMCLGIYRACLG